MSTKTEKPLVEQAPTQVADMPPLDVVTTGIPDQEHLTPPPVEAPRDHRIRNLVWALVGVLSTVLAIAAIVVLTPFAATGGHMGLTADAWQEFRAGERAPLAASLSAHMGLTTAAWQDYRTGERAEFLNPYAGHQGLTTAAWQDYRAGERTA